MAGKRVSQDLDDLRRVVDRKRGLRDVGKLCRIARAERPGIARRLDQGHGALRQLSHGADDLGVALVADEHDFASALGMARCLGVDLGDERTGGIQDEHIARRGGLGDGLGHPVCRKDHGLGGGWNF